MPSHIHLAWWKWQTTTNLGAAGEELGASCIAGGNGKWYSHCVKCMGSSSKVKVELPYNLAISTESMCPHKKLSRVCSGSIICNSQKSEEITHFPTAQAAWGFLDLKASWKSPFRLDVCVQWWVFLWIALVNNLECFQEKWLSGF